MAFPNLPGVDVTLNDLGLQISPPPQGTKVTILGYTSNQAVPKNEPLAVLNAGQAMGSLYFGTGKALGDQIGKFPGEMALAIQEAASAGAENIEIMVIGHISGQKEINHHVRPTGAGSQNRYQDLAVAYDILKDKDVDIVLPVNAWADDVGTSGQFGTQLANFCYQATTEIDSASIGVLPMMKVNDWALRYQYEIASGTSGNLALLSELNSLSPDAGDLYFKQPSTALVSAWARYASQYDGLGTIEVNKTNANPNRPGETGLVFPSWWKAYLEGSEDVGGQFLVVTNTANSATAVNVSYFGKWQATDTLGNLVVDSLGNKADVGSRVSIFGAPVRTSNGLTADLARGVGAAPSNTFHVTDGAASYAGMIARLRPHSAPTNKQISTLAPLRALSAKQVNALAARRIVTMHSRSTGFVVSSAMTGAHNVSKFVRSDFVRLSTVRITDAAIDIVRAIGERFIGEPNTAAHRNAMSAEIDAMLQRMKVASALNDYQFSVSATPDQQVLGEVEIDLSLVPAFEITRINLTVSLAKEIQR
jgi:hypothetical protein